MFVYFLNIKHLKSNNIKVKYNINRKLVLILDVIIANLKGLQLYIKNKGFIKRFNFIIKQCYLIV